MSVVQPLRRRVVLAIAGSAAGAPFGAAFGQAPSIQSAIAARTRAEFEAFVRNAARGTPIRPGRVKLEMPALADSGNAVPIKISVDSPMTDADHVRAVYLLSERNPVQNMASFHFVPASGRAQVVSRVRLAGTQQIVALAEMSDGSFWSGATDVVVTLSACIDEI